MHTDDRLVWLDLEMTGLDPDKNVIVEIATLITEADLTLVAEGPDLVLHATEDDLAAMIPLVQEMHAKSGLTEQIRASTITVADAEQQTLAFIREHCPTPRVHPLCGNTIGTDRRFLAKHMNELEEFLSYRSVDVSSIKELARRWYPRAYAARPAKAECHRALDDIRESVAELAYWRGKVFR